MNILKYTICYLCEKHHRRVFDKWYPQDAVITLRGKFDIWLLDLIQILIPDYRRFLKQWHTEKKNDYLRYTAYWN